jgi:pentatricopeptide repeat protein
MSSRKSAKSTEIEIAQTVRDACISAVKRGFQDASMNGLCKEGSIEAAISAIQLLDMEKIIAESR